MILHSAWFVRVFSQGHQNTERGHGEIIIDLVMKAGIGGVRPLHGCGSMDSCLVNPDLGF